MQSDHPTTITDLQIYITRSPGPTPASFKQFPKIYAAARTAYGLRDIGEPEQDDVIRESTASDPPRYIAIANSSAVQELVLPFSPREITDVTQRLESGNISIHDLVSFGSTLFNFVFTGTIRDLFRSLTSSGDVKIRVTIASALPELAVIPWELMCDAHLDYFPRFLCNQSNIFLNRSLRMYNRTDVNTSSFSDSSLRILLVTANPIERASLDLDSEEGLLRFAINQAPAISNVELESIRDADVNKLDEKIKDFQPHIVHFAGHGGYDAESDLGYVVLCSQNRRPGYDPVNCFRFSSLMRLSDSLKLVFLNNCHGAHQGLISSQSGIAQSLSASDIPGVVSMKFAITDATAHAIVLNFYRLLLRENKPVEECVSLIRRYLFVNGYHPSESFGITYFQNNDSLIWRGGVPIDYPGADTMSFDTFYELWAKGASPDTLSGVKSEVDNIKGLLERAGKLSPVDVILASRIFDDVEMAFDILQRVTQAGIASGTFLKVCRAAVKLCQTPDEKELVQTSILVTQKKGEDLLLQSVAPLANEFLFGDPSLIVKEAKHVDGYDRSFSVVDEGANKYASGVVNIKAVQPADALCNPQFAKLCTIVRESGCAFALPGKARVKLLVGAGQIAEYRYGVWRRCNFEKLAYDVRKLVPESEIAPSVLRAVINTCAVASDIGQGLAIIVSVNSLDGRDLMEKCSKRFKSVDENGKYDELKLKAVFDLEPKLYLRLTSGDGAILMTRFGKTIAINAHLPFAGRKSIEAIPGVGTRHLSAQAFSQEMDAIAFVVSVDGPVTVFKGGKLLGRAW
jgi:hypothetical protein